MINALVMHTAEQLRRVAEIMEEEGIESRYVAILLNHGPDNVPLVSIDEQAFRVMFFGCKVTGKQETCMIRLTACRHGIIWQTNSYHSPAVPESVDVQL